MVISPTGSSVISLPENPKPQLEAPLARNVLEQLFANMLRARLLSENVRRTTLFSEAVLAGTIQNLHDDLVLCAGEHSVLRTVYEAATQPDVPAVPNSSLGKSLSRFIAAPPDTAVSIATGLALATLRSASSAAVVAVVTPALTKGKAWQQATEFAARERLPLVVVSDGTQVRPPSRDRHEKNSSQWPFPTIAVDGRDVIAVYRVTKEALSAARRGHGPTLVDGVNFVAPGRRGRDNRDPLAAFRAYLERHNLWSDSWYSELRSRYEQEIVPTRQARPRSGA